jgi:hypothetical protein
VRRGRGSAFLRGAFGFRLGGRSRILAPIVAAKLEDDVVVERAGVRLFVGDAEFGKPL